MASRRWAVELLGQSSGHHATVNSWIRVVAAAADHPDGTITATFQDPAIRLSAYRRLADSSTSLEWLATSIHLSTARACAERSMVFVPMDGSSLNITDTAHEKGTGSVGTRSLGATGFIVLNAMAVSLDGVPLGMCGQQWWARGPKHSRPRNARKLPEKETRFWIEQMAHVASVFKTDGDGCRPWLQMDRGADAGEVLEYAVANEILVTVRAAHDRRVRRPSKMTYLWSTMKRQPVLGSYDVEVPARPGRAARTAVLNVRASTVKIDLRNRWTNTHRALEIGVVVATEVGPLRKGEARLEWLLYTTSKIKTLADALLVIRGYVTRWSIEELHRTWKSGLCNVESTQLHSADRMQKWATVLASVAARAQRLKHLARQSPDVPATDELDSYQIEAIILLRKAQGYRHDRRSTPTLWQAVDWIARLGGYTGKSSGGPPGQIVISRGLIGVEAAARALRALAEQTK